MQIKQPQPQQQQQTKINKQQTKQTQKKINLGSAGCLLVYETLLAKHSTLGKMVQEQGLVVLSACK